MGGNEIARFLTHLANEKVAASTQNQALCAIVFLYKHVLNKEPGEFEGIVWAKRTPKLPVVLTKQEVKNLLSNLSGGKWIMANMLYDAGLRLLECLRLRVGDIDFNYRQIIVRNGKGEKDRVTMLPGCIIDSLKEHLDSVRKLHQKDLDEGFGKVYLPHALDRKYPNANREWVWQYVFPSFKRSVDPRSGLERRHHLNEMFLQRAIKEAVEIRHS